MSRKAASKVDPNLIVVKEPLPGESTDTDPDILKLQVSQMFVSFFVANSHLSRVRINPSSEARAIEHSSKFSTLMSTISPTQPILISQLYDFLLIEGLHLTYAMHHNLIILCPFFWSNTGPDVGL